MMALCRAINLDLTGVRVEHLRPQRNKNPNPPLNVDLRDQQQSLYYSGHSVISSNPITKKP